MKGGILEVLLVSAKDIRRTNLFGSPAYYVMIECGTQEYRTKVSLGKHENAWWNEKLRFQLPSSDWRNTTHIKFKIIESEILNNQSVGETVIHVGGIISEGYKRGFIHMKPVPYNVVLQDDTYKGEIKIGFKFFANEDMESGEKEAIIEEKPKTSICRNVANLWRIVWFKLLGLYDQNDLSQQRKKL